MFSNLGPHQLSSLVRIGIGLMIVKALEENGAKVYIVGRRKEMLEKVAREEAVRWNMNSRLKLCLKLAANE